MQAVEVGAAGGGIELPLPLRAPPSTRHTSSFPPVSQVCEPRIHSLPTPAQPPSPPAACLLQGTSSSMWLAAGRWRRVRCMCCCRRLHVLLLPASCSRPAACSTTFAATAALLHPGPLELPPLQTWPWQAIGCRPLSLRHLTCAPSAAATCHAYRCRALVCDARSGSLGWLQAWLRASRCLSSCRRMSITITTRQVGRRQLPPSCGLCCCCCDTAPRFSISPCLAAIAGSATTGCRRAGVEPRPHACTCPAAPCGGQGRLLRCDAPRCSGVPADCPAQARVRA